MSREEQLEYLEHLRKKARIAYFYLGFLLICVLVSGLLLDTAYLIGAGILSFMIYIFWLRKDIKKYPAEYRKIATINSVGRHISVKYYAPKNLFTLERVKKDGCIIIDNTHGIVRAGVMGSYPGGNVFMSDISYTCKEAGSGSKGAVVRSGCYVRIELEKENENFGIKDFCRTSGQVVIKKENGFLYGFFPHRFLGLREPGLKRALTKEEINPDIFPELAGFLEEYTLATKLDRTSLSAHSME